MRIVSVLSATKDRAGHVWAEDAHGDKLTEVYRARGEADNANAAKNHNEREDPTLVGGDHPSGTFRITDVMSAKLGDEYRLEHYGPETLHLDPIAGDALLAKQNGRTLLAIHGGKLLPDGGLRATLGCLRVDDYVSAIFAAMVQPALARHEEVLYECRDAT